MVQITSGVFHLFCASCLKKNKQVKILSSETPLQYFSLDLSDWICNYEIISTIPEKDRLRSSFHQLIIKCLWCALVLKLEQQKFKICI